MLEQLKEMLKEVVADDELFELMAKTMRRLHGALVKEGFTQDQATQITASQAVGLLE